MKKCMAFVFAVLFVFFCFSGCAGDDESVPVVSDDVSEYRLPDISYVSTEIYYSEPADTLTMRIDMDMTVLNNITFYFEEEIPNTDRERCIGYTTAVFGKLNVYKEVQIYVFEETTFDCSFVSDGAIYTCVNNIDKPTFFEDLLLAVFGEYCNYGMVCGYAEYLIDELLDFKIPYEAPTFDKDWQYYDLNLLCFDLSFTNSEDMLKARSIACDFVYGYISEYGANAFHKLLASSGSLSESGEARNALLDYYAKNGISPVLSDILYCKGGASYQYYAACEYAVFYVSYGWKDRLQERAPSAYDGFLNFDYQRTREYFEITVNEFESYRTLLGLESYKEGLGIFFADKNSYYYEKTHSINMQSHANLMYTYILSLVSERDMDFWKSRGLAAVLNLKYDIYGVRTLNEYYKNRGNGSYWKFANAFVEKTGRDIDVSTDMGQLQDLYVYFSKNYDLDNGDSAASFTNYLVSVFGEDKTVSYLLGNIELSELTDKSLDTLIGEWKNYINTEYKIYDE